MDTSDIYKLIPHREPFLWIDSVEIIEVGKIAIGFKSLSNSELIFNGHFPGNPIFPGVLIIEAMAQTGAVLLKHGSLISNESSKLIDRSSNFDNSCGYLAKTDIRFFHPVFPGNLISFNVTNIKNLDKAFYLDCKAFVNKIKVAEGNILVTHPVGSF